MTSLIALALIAHQEQPARQQDKHRFIQDRAFQLDKLKQAECKIGKHKFKLWVMDTDAKRMEGMMFVTAKDFKDDEGMIFVFPNEDFRRFWMRNTLVDLDITYNDKDGKINTVLTMTKLDETTDYSSKGPALTVIELRDGTAKKLGLEEGMTWEIPEWVVAKD
ncbi:MAG: DUF192 domain-containing protein [Chthonomonadaceae bacterium]|jgi:uncharacterized membrane protein (UPF0127 family)|nr:DUF192 domain-containing protein [Chthonomonadaceae bacterium]